jgi:hypothetical protein
MRVRVDHKTDAVYLLHVRAEIQVRDDAAKDSAFPIVTSAIFLTMV